jgi:hypothetical protein
MVLWENTQFRHGSAWERSKYQKNWGCKEEAWITSGELRDRQRE